MRKFLKFIFIINFVIILITNQVSALKITTNNSSFSFNKTNGIVEQNIKNEEVFYFFSRFFEKETPKSYKFISLNFNGIIKGSKLEDSLKRLVYKNKIPNLKANINGNKSMKAYDFYRFSNLILSLDISNINKDELLKRNVNSNDLNLVKNSYYLLKQKKIEDNKSVLEKNYLFENVYSTIKSKHYNKKNIKDDELLYSAIEGLAKGAKDKHTIFFPPSKNKIFKQSLSGNFEGIGAYVELSKPGFFIIQNPIPGSPAEKAGLKGGDRIIKVNENTITKDNSSKEIISWIKGPSGTKVKLTILRGEKKFELEITRSKIHINNIDYELKNNGIHYIKIKNFGENVSDEFAEILKEINSQIGAKKIIFDLRNNGGGLLEEVVKMLSYIIPKGEPTAIIRYQKTEKVYNSEGFNYIDLSNYKVIILQNSGTASASEIMIGTIKDYFPGSIVIGEKSYGKGSVQTIQSYSDGSSFKYTIAKWFTGKSKTGIDGKGITPDVELELDIKKLQQDGSDNQLNEALNK